VTGGLLSQLGRLVLALFAQLLSDGADVVRRRPDTLTELCRALVDLGPSLVARLRRNMLRLLLSLLANFRRSLSHVDPPFLWYSG
jgi:hypothetical protein